MEHGHALGISLLGHEPDGVGVAHAGVDSDVLGAHDPCSIDLAQWFHAVGSRAPDGPHYALVALVVSMHSEAVLAVYVGHTLHRV